MPRNASTSTSAKPATKPTARKIAPKVTQDAVVEVDTTFEEPVLHETPEAPPAPEKQVFRVKEHIDPHMYVTVRNGFNGKLVYVSKRTGERWVWDSFGAEQDMELQELKNAKNASRAFFENNWFLIDNVDVIAYLGVERYYKNALRLEDFDNIFTLTADEIAAKVALLSDGQKSSVAYRARQKITNEEIDSLKVITALEDSLGVELIER